MRVGGRVSRTIVLRLRFDDFTWATRSHTLPQPTALRQSMLAIARPTIERRGLALIGAAVGNLENDGAVQLMLPLDRHGSGDLDAAADRVHDRFGSNALTRAGLVGRDQGLSVPLLPD